MRWQAPSERVKMILLSPLLIVCVPILLVALSPLPLMEAITRWRWKRNAANPRRVWYAWRPVRFDGFWEDVPTQWLWLEHVQARWQRTGWVYMPLGFVSRYDEDQPA